MQREMHIVRGGPWPRPTLSTSMAHQIKDCSTCTDLEEISRVSTKYPQGSIAKHLADVSFKEDGQPISKSRRSGTAGNLYRRRQIRDGVLEQGSDEHVRLPRGTNPVATRKKENAKRIR